MPSLFNGRRFFLTYPRCELSKESLGSFLKSVGEVKYLLVARELHEDGCPHLHACVEYAAVVVGGVRKFDFESHHPNKQDPRKWRACCQYVKKGEDFFEETQNSEGPSVDVHRINLEVACKECATRLEWIEYCVKENISHAYCNDVWNIVKGDVNTLVDGIEVHGSMFESLRILKFDPACKKTWILKGPSGCGKTTWAKINMPKPCLFISHIDDLKKFKVGFHKSIIFDDVDFRHFPRTAQIHVVDNFDVRSIHCRHVVATLPAGVHKVFTCNEWPLNVADEAVKRRVRLFNIN